MEILFLIGATLSFASIFLSYGAHSIKSNEKKALEFVHKVLNDEVPVKVINENIIEYTEGIFEVTAKRVGSMLYINLKNNFYQEKRPNTNFYTYSLEVDLEQKDLKVTHVDNRIFMLDDKAFIQLSQKLLHLITGEKEVKKNVEKEIESFVFEDKELQEKANHITGLYEKIKSEENSPLDIEERHNFDTLYKRDYANLLKTYFKLSQKGEKEKEKMLFAMDLILEKMKKFEEKNEQARKNEFERVVETIRLRK